jgi:hypothetical protein
MSAHRHKFTRLVEWVRAPSGPASLELHWQYTVRVMCDCGTTKTRDASHTEVKEYVEAKTCTCGQFDAAHKDPSACIRELRDRVTHLEDRLDDLKSKLRSLS